MPHTSRLVPADETTIAHAASLLRAGKLVAFPTETVYGLGADATNDKAVAAIYAAKGRPEINPLIIHVADSAALSSLIEWTETAQLLASQFWPGPLTLVLRRSKDCPVSLLASAGMDTLAVRIPSHPAARNLLRQTGKPIAAPSANLSGKLSPTTPMHVAESLGDRVDLILAGGKSEIGLESTVVDLVSPEPRVLRPGGVTKEQLEQVIGPLTTAIAGDTFLSPGQLPSHYAPDLAVRLNAHAAAADEAFLTFGPDAFAEGGGMRLNLSATGDLVEAAANLFAMLRKLDDAHYRAIAVMPIPNQGLGAAINDRLRRASVR